VPPTPRNLRPTPPAALQASLWQPTPPTAHAPVTAATARPTTIQGRFEAFDAQHPEFYQAFRQIALDLWGRGVQRYGAKAIVEVIRFQRVMQGVVDTDGFRANNVYTSRMARRLMDECPDLSEFFEIRQLKSA
jgi:hypothetical protein